MAKTKGSKYFHDWQVKAGRDLDTAFLLYGEDGYTDTICYFCHQCAEKALKAHLLYTGIKEIPLIHNLITLLMFCIKKDKNFIKLKGECKILNQYYVEAKYPVSPPIDYPRREAEEAIKKAEEVLRLVEKIIGKS